MTLAPFQCACLPGIVIMRSGRVLDPEGRDGDGATDWISSWHAGSWPAYLESTDPSLATPMATLRPMRTPDPPP